MDGPSPYKVYEFQCDLCGRKFIDTKNKLYHERIVHNKEMSKCPICNHVGSRHFIQKHINTVHKMLTKWNKNSKRSNVKRGST